MIVDTFHNKKCIISCHLDISRALLLCVIWVIYAYNAMLNLGTGMENVTDLTPLQNSTFRCGPASESLARH